jgi:DNA repair photolyase
VRGTAIWTGRPLIEPLPECGVWSLCPYDACSYRCTYCITGVQGRARPRAEPDVVVDQLQRELAGIDREAHLGVGALCDAYPPIEAEAGLTRRVLVELVDQGRPFSVITKGSVVRRDADLLAAAAVRPCVTVSLSSLDAEVLASLDPAAPTPAERLATVAALARAGVSTSLSISPWLPGVTDVPALVEAVRTAAGSGVWIVVAPLNVRAPQVAASPFAAGWDQAEINRAYVAARGEADDLGATWMPEIPLDGHHAPAMHPASVTAAQAPG